ncbi:extracellular solute-binding protein [Paenibacillus macquariensis]|uniref:Carbohydrate ABC transporter substrate-binding protein, CUT1 family n=1 Tax=Paenibacillus macquariensis TaxID=948756 RepID=A0ABY1K8N6_9BACL|nr:extracellular solute-binding protein [Paenibacillus macquariensis]MEC0093272.1 extracellular solute-binding protein [Paenibacillus macquariensis]OAB27564.1 ABC transporter substrate-binding protein [Paenibacillus macquariensis subsp. macquariensis]SIR41060.1 carbohydrate ABC transporter substrate-binding protein, CUT1 family [Paenibacillus macquariensis]
MNKKVKLASSVLSTAMALSLVVGCASNNEKAEAPKEPAKEGNKQETKAEEPQKYELGKEQLDISLFGAYDWYTMKPKWGSDEVTKFVQDTKKVTITEIPNGGNAVQKLNTMIASGELPDVIWGERGPDVERLREAGMLVPLDDYIEKYPNLKKWLDPLALNMLRSPDGKIYQFPNWYTNRPNGNAGWVVNKKIYAELGSPKLETTDDLYSYLKLVKEKFPDVVPFESDLAKEGQGIDQIFSAFKEDNLSFTRYFAVPEGDKMTSIYKDQGFRESVVYAAKLFREKLMTQDAMTQTRDQVQEKLNNGKVAVYASTNPTTFAMEANSALAKVDPDAGYFMVMPIHKEGLDVNKIFPGTYNKLGWNAAVITTSAKDPEAVFAFLDYWTGNEGMTLQMWGLEGGYWDGFESDGVTPKFTEKYKTDKNGLAEYQTKMDPLMWVGNTVYVDDIKGKFESTLSESERNWSTYWQYQITWKTQGDATEFINLFPQPESEEGIAFQRAKDIWLKVRAQTLYAKTDEEALAMLDKAHEDTMSAGFQGVLDFYATKWHENQAMIKGQ